VIVKKRKIGIIGLGPRGGFALENLLVELESHSDLSQLYFLLFEETGNWGNGHVYNLDQPKSNWINISERFLELEERKPLNFGEIKIPRFPSYHHWVDKDFEKKSELDADTYPPRATIGKYLTQRFHSLIEPLVAADSVSMVEERVIDLLLDDSSKAVISTKTRKYTDIDEVLLTIGHQPTLLSDQLEKWDSYAKVNAAVQLYKSPYPISAFVDAPHLTSKSIIGIRGFGLGFIDVVRAIANKFGNFQTTNKAKKECSYESSHPLESMLVPFSLDGLPQGPKPLNAKLDSWYKPTSKQLELFTEGITAGSVQKKAKNAHFLIDIFSSISADIFLKHSDTYLKENLSSDEMKAIIERWMLDEEYQHSLIMPKSRSVRSKWEEYVAMAIGDGSISLDYCLGQVWRHCQPSIYDGLSFSECSEDVFAEVIALDERMKRFAYGPPVESIQQMLALARSGVLDLSWIDNPDICVDLEGWILTKKGKSVTATIMINSVLDSPKVKAVSSSLVEGLLSNDFIKTVHTDLGIKTNKMGYVTAQNESKDIPIALLGRLAKGTIIGVDAILECFGKRPKLWAAEAAIRHVNRTL
jgi:uncharacterized NAD(P)/FAD-binding protein YdhS